MVNSVATDASIRLGVFDMEARIYQGGKLVFGQASYSWCAREGLNGAANLWTDLNIYCNLLLTTQVSGACLPVQPLMGSNEALACMTVLLC